MFMSIAPLLQIIVPLKREKSLISTAPSTIQNTFSTLVPFINTTFEKVLVEKAPFTWITKTALGFPSAFRKTVSVKVTAPFII